MALSKETEVLLGKILITLAEGERNTEISRQVLSDNFDFEPFQIFKFLDKENKNYIDSKNLINYFKSKNVFINETEAQLIILFYDQNFDGVLCYSEFMKLIQSKKCFQSSTDYSLENNISFTIDYSLFKVLQKELELSRKIISLLSHLKNKSDFNIHNLYHSIKNVDCITPESIKNFLEKNSISYFDSDIIAVMKRLDLNSDGRVDLFEFHLFLGFPNCCYCCPCIACKYCGVRYCENCFCNKVSCCIHGRVHNSCHSPANSRHNSPMKIINNNNTINNSQQNLNYKNGVLNNNNNLENNINRNNNNDKNDNEINNNDKNNNDVNDNNNDINSNRKSLYNTRNDSNFNTLQKTDGQIDGNNQNFNKTKINENLTLRLSPQRKYSPRNYTCQNCNLHTCNCCCECCMSASNFHKSNNKSARYNSSNLYSSLKNIPSNKNNISYDQIQFNDFLKNLMLAETEIENAKINLALKNDFNIENAFRLFEHENRGFLLPEDVLCGLNLLEIYPTELDIKLFMKRFDLKKNNIINYADFFDIFVPFEKELRLIVENRIPNNCIRCLDTFSYETLVSLKNLINLILVYERKFNFMRKSLRNLNLNEIFSHLDYLKLGFFTNSDLTVYLQKNGMFISNHEADLLFIRLDKNRNGKIDYQEIYDEIQALY